MRYFIIIVLSGLLCAGCATTNLQPVTSDAFIPKDDENRLWLRSAEEQDILNRSGHIYENDKLEKYLNDVAGTLQPPEVMSNINFRVIVLKNPYFNAFAFPNGVIYVHTGILARMDNEAQLVILLAHEMTHSTHRHAVRNFRNMKNYSSALATLQVASGGLGVGLGDVVRLLGQVGTMAAVTGYSRGMEKEADEVGFSLMVNAGYDPDEASQLFVYMKKELEEEDIKEPFFFGSHPRLQDRIDNLEELSDIEHMGKVGKTKNEEIFQENIRELIIDNAVLDLKAGRFNTAQRGVERYLNIDPESAEAYYLLGEIYRQKNGEEDFEKAKEHYVRAISIDPSHPEAYKGIGLIHHKQRNKGEANNNFHKYIALYPDAPDKSYIEYYIKQNTKGENE